MSIPVSNYKNIAFSSLFNYENVLIKGSAQGVIGTTANSIGTATITHNLGYAPFYRVYVQFPGDSRIFDAGTGPNTFGLVSDFQMNSINANTTTLLVSVLRNGTGGGTFTVYYRIYKEQR